MVRNLYYFVVPSALLTLWVTADSESTQLVAQSVKNQLDVLSRSAGSGFQVRQQRFLACG